MVEKCDNTDHKGQAVDIQEVKMLAEFEGGKANWCRSCRDRDGEMIEKGEEEPIITEDEAIKWLEAEYPRGVDLVYIDYNDSLSDNLEGLAEVLKQGYMEDEDWIWDAQGDSVSDIIHRFREERGAEELSEEVRDAMRDWLEEKNTSDVYNDLLKNTRDKLFYIETRDYCSIESRAKDKKRLAKKYGKSAEQVKEIEYVINEQFYSAPVSFYFRLSPLDVFKALHKEKGKYIIVKGAYFSTIDRVQGSNWLGNDAIFNIAISREDFLNNVYLDDGKGTGYGWEKIAGQVDYDDGAIYASAKRPAEAQLIKTETSEQLKREARLEENWQKTKKCQMGDMKMSRHNKEDVEYINNYPCGHKCKACGTFWID